MTRESLGLDCDGLSCYAWICGIQSPFLDCSSDRTVSPPPFYVVLVRAASALRLAKEPQQRRCFQNVVVPRLP